MKRKLIFIAVAGTAALGCQSTSHEPQAANSSEADRQYMQVIVDRDQDMIAIARSAEQIASSDHFRRMAHNCVAKQSEESHQLLDWLVQWYGVQYAPHQTADGHRMLEHLTSLKGTDFDHDYLTDMIHEYQANVDASRPESSSARHAKLRSFAQQLVKDDSHQASHLQEHLAELAGPNAAHDAHAGGNEHAHDEH